MSSSEQKPPPVGLSYRAQMVVEARHTVPAVDAAWPGFREKPAVFDPAMMVGFIEQTCVEALAPRLLGDQRTVGTHVSVSHTAATAVDMTVGAEVELAAVDGQQLSFRVRCYDDAGPIGEGTHNRVIVDAEKFWARVQDKRQKLKAASTGS